MGRGTCQSHPWQKRCKSNQFWGKVGDAEAVAEGGDRCGRIFREMEKGAVPKQLMDQQGVAMGAVVGEEMGLPRQCGNVVIKVVGWTKGGEAGIGKAIFVLVKVWPLDLGG